MSSTFKVERFVQTKEATGPIGQGAEYEWREVESAAVTNPPYRFNTWAEAKDFIKRMFPDVGPGPEHGPLPAGFRIVEV